MQLTYNYSPDSWLPKSTNHKKNQVFCFYFSVKECSKCIQHILHSLIFCSLWLQDKASLFSGSIHPSKYLGSRTWIPNCPIVSSLQKSYSTRLWLFWFPLEKCNLYFHTKFNTTPCSIQLSTFLPNLLKLDWSGFSTLAPEYIAWEPQYLKDTELQHSWSKCSRDFLVQ